MEEEEEEREKGEVCVTSAQSMPDAALLCHKPGAISRRIKEQ